MKKSIVLFIIFTILFFSIFSGCMNNSNNDMNNNDNHNNISDAEAQKKIIGLWYRTNYDRYQTWNFLSNGSVVISNTGLNMGYWFDNGSLYTYIPNIDYLDRYIYKFENDFKDLTLSLISNDVIIDPETGKIDPNEIIFEIKFIKLN
jgi:hypothetical protein